jgi:HD-GYP domain-containing protein (c-di-GMP phosphodiesterase class II)
VVALATLAVRALLLRPGTGSSRGGSVALSVALILGSLCVIFWIARIPVDSTHIQGKPTLIYLVSLAIVLSATSYSLAFGEESFGVDQVLPVLIASYLISGTYAAVVVAASLALVPEPAMEPVKNLFNGSVKVVCVFASGSMFEFLSQFPLHGGDRSTVSVLDAWLAPQNQLGAQIVSTSKLLLIVIVIVLLSTLVFLAVNTFLIAAIVSATHDSSLFATWAEIGRNVGGPLVLNSALGLILASVYLHSDVQVMAMVLVLLPLFAARWVFAQIAGERAAQEATLAALIKAVETKDWYTKGHSERVAVAALQIGGSLKLDSDLMRELRFAGMLHDVGKLGVPTGVLIKPGRLDEAEFDAIKRHPLLGQEVVRGIDFLDEAKRGIYYHHERMDGRGYPEGLKGDDIPMFARILGVADAFDSMTQVRSYRGARSVEAALVELDAHRNSQFDTCMVDALIAALDAGWKPDTPPEVSQPEAPNGVPALGVDDDDPSAAAALAAHRPAKVDAP